MQNVERSIKEFESNEVYLETYPSIIFMELTENCNCRCPMCRGNYRNGSDKNMPFSLYKKIADDLFPYAKYIDFRGWGESLLLRYFTKYVNYAKRFDAKFKIITNLSVKNDNYLNYLVANDFLIGISLDAAEEGLCKRIRTGSDYKLILRNLGVLISLMEKLDKSKDNIYFTVTVSALNLDNLIDIIKLAEQLGIHKIKLNPITIDSENPFSLSKEKSHIEKIIENIKEESAEISIEFNASLHEELSIESAIRKRCIHPWMYCYINHKGHIGFCDHLIGPSYDSYLLGDISREDFKGIWNNEKAIRLRQQHIDHENGLLKEFDACNWCYKNRYIDLENIIHPNYSKYVISKKNLLGIG